MGSSPILVALALVLASPAGAAVTGDPAAEALAAWNRGDHAAARPLLRRLALEGDASAMTLLGVMAFRGLDGPKAPAVAAAWYMKAARQDHVPALLALANAYRRGAGVVKDEKRAAELEARARRLRNLPGALAAR